MVILLPSSQSKSVADDSCTAGSATSSSRGLASAALAAGLALAVFLVTGLAGALSAWAAELTVRAVNDRLHASSSWARDMVILPERGYLVLPLSRPSAVSGRLKP